MKKAPVLDANGKRKFGMLDKLAYAAGDIGCNMSFGLKGTVQTFWLVYMTMETGLLSLLLLLVQAWDAVIPVEVKSGDVVKSASLRYYARKHPEAASLMFRLSLRSLTLDDATLNVPLYLADHAIRLASAATAARASRNAPDWR
jgi:hypothetical protein